MRGLNPIKSLHGEGDLTARLRELEREIRALQARRRDEVLVNEFEYPPRVQEALDFIERESKEYIRRERQARCGHRRRERIDDATVDNPLRYIMKCLACGLATEHNPAHEGPDACLHCLGHVMPPYREHPDAPDTKIVMCDRCAGWHEVSTKAEKESQ